MIEMVKPRFPRPLFFVLAVFLAGLFITRAAKELSNAPEYAKVHVNNRVNYWLDSAQCAHDRHVILATCTPSGPLRPIEDISIADDRGRTLIVDFLAMLKSTPITKINLVQINLWINIIGLLLLASVFYAVGLRWTSILSLYFGTSECLPGLTPSPDEMQSYIGVFCFMLVPLIWLYSVFISKIDVSKVKFIFWSYLSFVSLSWAILLRQPIGIVGVICSILIIVISVFRDKLEKYSVLKATFAILLVFFASQSLSALIAIRGSVFHVKQGDTVLAHGISHNLFIGLGAEQNPWGIIWQDEYALELVKKEDPSIKYCSPSYFSFLWIQYLNILRSDPIIVSKIYLRKLKRTFSYHIGIFGRAGHHMALLLLLIPLLLIKNFRSKDWLEIGLPSFILVATFIFSLQGVLAYPADEYIYPIKFGILISWACLINYFISRVSGQPVFAQRLHLILKDMLPSQPSKDICDQ